MANSAKIAQLQIRVTLAEKAAIVRAARRAGMVMSSYVLGKVLPAGRVRFNQCIAQCSQTHEPGYALAELNTFLAGLTALELSDAVQCAPAVNLTPFVANYVAAMVEFACTRRGAPTPAWTRDVVPLADPVFGTALESLRLHLLTQSPAPFRGRNIFIDSTLGQRL